MPLAKIHSQNLREMLSAIDDCLKAERQLPALILMYSLVDGLSWAESGDTNTKSRFEGWVTRWLLPHLPQSKPQITATDLYAARCALLHTGTGISDLVKSKKAKRIMYAWGGAKTEILERAIEVTESQAGHAAIHCSKLFTAIRKGMKGFVDSAEDDPQLKSRLQDAGSVQYDNVLL